MKRIKRLSLISVTFLFLFGLSSCTNGANTSLQEEQQTATEPLQEEQQRAIESLSGIEHQLFDAIIIATTKDFYEPSAVRLLEVGDYEDNTKKTAILAGPAVIVIRIQGENKVGGTLNHPYLICISAYEATEESSKDLADIYRNRGDIEKQLKYEGEVGDYCMLDDSYTIKNDGSSTFDIGRINNALKEYWEERGF